jgi:CheY-like chemotaxis protein
MAIRAPRVLVIDDEPDMVIFLCTWLEDNGYETCSAVDGERGLQLILEHRPDLVLMDLNMPYHSGFQLYRELLNMEDLRSIPVIFITGLSQYQIFDSECSPLPGPSACIQKPIDMQCLQAAIERALKPAEAKRL